MLIAGLQPFSLSDYPNCSSAIIFTVGCNFCCPYCHNKNLWHQETCQNFIAEEAVLNFLQNKQGKLDGLVITGGEPTVQNDLKSFIQKVKQLNYQVKLDTNGSNPLVLQELIQEKLLDFIAMDLKAPFSKYPQAIGTNIDIKNIKQSIEIIQNSNIQHLFRTTWDKNILTEQDIKEIKKTIKNSVFIVQKCNTTHF